MRNFTQNHHWLSLNTATVRKSRGQDNSLTSIIDACAKHEIRAISPWRDQVHAAGIENVAKQIKALGIELSGYCRGGFYPALDAKGLQAAKDDSRRAVDEAKLLNAPCLVMVVGGLPGALQAQPAHKNIALCRSQVFDGLADTLEYARQVGMPLAIEPLHPMQAAERACVNTLEYALDLCDELDPAQTGAIGVAVDVYHTWWDPKLYAQIERAGKRSLAFHVCDWLVPTTDLLNDRGMMGDGIIEIQKIRDAVERQGYAGYSEIEIFSSSNWWQREMGDVLRICIERHKNSV